MIGIVCAFFHTEGKGFYSKMIGIVCAFFIRKVRGFTVAANSGYDSRGSADPRESLRKRRISKLPLSAHKVLPAEQIPA